MAKYLTEEWSKAVADALNSNESFRNAARNAQISIQFHVSGVPAPATGDYWLSVADGQITYGVGERDGADVTINEDYETAAAINRGEMNPQAAFMQGKLKLAPGSNMGKLMQNLSLIQSMGPILKEVPTEY